MVFAMLRARCERRAVLRERLRAAEEFAWVWADTVNANSYAYGAELSARRRRHSVICS